MLILADRLLPVVNSLEPLRKGIDMESAWEVFPTEHDDKLAFIAVDLAFAEHAPIESHAVTHWATFVYDDEDGAGLPNHEQSEELAMFDDWLTDAVKSFKGMYVGRLTTAGRRRFFLYAPGDITVQLEASAADQFPNIEIEFNSNEDPEWSFYFEFLYPRPIDFLRIDTAHIVRQLESHGDVQSIERPIDHFAYFPTRAARDAFKSIVSHERFMVTSEDDREPEEENPYALQFQSNSPTALPKIDPHIVSIFMRVEECGGVYDGWGCPVVKPES